MLKNAKILGPTSKGDVQAGAFTKDWHLSLYHITKPASYLTGEGIQFIDLINLK